MNALGDHDDGRNWDLLEINERSNETRGQTFNVQNTEHLKLITQAAELDELRKIQNIH